MNAVAVEELEKHYRIRSGRGEDRVVHAVDGVSFEVSEGRTLSIIGESGCGKSTIARMLVRLADPTGGRILVQGRDGVDRRAIQLVSQNPWSALNRRKSIRHALEQPLAEHGLHPGRAARAARVRELLELVGLTEEYLDRRPGGVRPGGEHEVVVVHALAPIGGDPLRVPVDGHDGRPLAQGDVRVAPDLVATEVQVLRVAAGEVGREGHSVVRRSGFVTDDGHPEAVTVVARPQRLHETEGDHAGPGNHDVLLAL